MTEPPKPPWQIDFAARLRSLRQRRGLSIKELASQARIYWVELDRYERAEQIPTLDRVYTLARILDATLTELLPPTK